MPSNKITNRATIIVAAEVVTEDRYGWSKLRVERETVDSRRPR